MAEVPDSKPSINPSFGFQMVIVGIKKRFPAVRNISTEELQELISQHAEVEEKGVVIFDVRAEEEYRVSHIPSAIRVDPQTQDVVAVKQLVYEQVSEQSPDKPVDVVMYCSVGYRSSAVAYKLIQLLRDEKKGRNADTNQAQTLSLPPNPPSEILVYNLEGSLFKWANENREMVDGVGSATKFVHPYSSMWGQLVSKDIRKWAGS